jgi:probable F420-dependent oxidoreductase
MNLVFRMPGGSVPASVDLLSASSIGRVARTAEDAGWAGVCFDEHPIPPAYWRDGGDGHDAVDPFVALAVAAAVTRRIRLVVYATIVSIRNPFLLAKTVATLDVISGGRVELGMVAGYLPEEFAALGVSFERRNQYFEENVDAMKSAWTGEPVTLHTERFDAVDVRAQPRPVQRPHPPLWVGGNSRAAMRRVVKCGAGWMALVNPRGRSVSRRSPTLETVDDFRRLVALLHAEAETAGRTDRIPVMVSANFNPDEPVQRLKRTLEKFEDAGAGWAVVNVPSYSVDDACRSLELLADELGAYVASS